MDGRSIGVLLCWICWLIGIGVAWTCVSFFLLAIGVLAHLHPWKMWPLWVGPLLVVGSPFIVLALHLPFILLGLPYILLLKATSTLRQRTSLATIQMEEGLRANQIHIDAANAEATRLAAERAAQPGGPHPGDRAGAGAEASPPAIDTGETNVPTDKSTPSVAAGPEPAQTPAAAPPESGTIAPPEPVYIGSSTQKL